MRAFLCRIGLHSYGTMWSNIAPRSGGGPMFITERCRRCPYTKDTRNPLW